MLDDLAPAKINLFLHVRGRRDDGYHLLESLVSFADIGDRLSLAPGSGLELRVDGPFADGLAAEADNLVLQAARLFAARIRDARLGTFRLTKNLPIASGVGGGSSDAAAALRLLARLNGIGLDDPLIMDCARLLGADVPVCLEDAPRIMGGIGHELGPPLAARGMAALLVNPGIAVETRTVFARLGLKPGERSGNKVPDALGSTNDPIDRLRLLSANHLEAPALAHAPEIGVALDLLSSQPGCSLARMSGSGATCFALFGAEPAAGHAARAISAEHPNWWVAPCRIAVPL